MQASEQRWEQLEREFEERAERWRSVSEDQRQRVQHRCAATGRAIAYEDAARRIRETREAMEGCACGEPSTEGVVHRQDGPCYRPDPQPEQERCGGSGEYVVYAGDGSVVEGGPCPGCLDCRSPDPVTPSERVPGGYSLEEWERIHDVFDDALAHNPQHDINCAMPSHIQPSGCTCGAEREKERLHDALDVALTRELAPDAPPLERAVERFLDCWDEFDGPPLTPQDTFNAVAESVESLRAALTRSGATPSERERFEALAARIRSGG